MCLYRIIFSSTREQFETRHAQRAFFMPTTQLSIFVENRNKMKKILYIFVVVATVCLAAHSKEVYSTIPLATNFNMVDNLKYTKMVEKEEWRDVVGYEGLYEVSNLGRIRSVDRRVPFRGSNIFKRGCMITPIDDGKGYLRVGLWKESESRLTFVHKIVLMAFVDNPHNKPHINHIDCNPSNNRVENLEWCTPSENMQHALKKGRYVSNFKPMIGAENPKSKAVVQIDMRGAIIAEYESQFEAMRETGVSNKHISMVVTGKWGKAGGFVWKYKKDMA